MNLLIVDPDHPHYGKTAKIVPLERTEPEVTIVELKDGTRTSVISAQVRWEWRDGTDA